MMKTKINIKESVQANVTFSHYNDGNLWYKTMTGDLFPVPVSDIGAATFLAVDKGILFMRYMRKWNEATSEDSKTIKVDQIYESNISGNTYRVLCLNAANWLTLRQLNVPGFDFMVMQACLLKEYTLIEDSKWPK